MTGPVGGGTSRRTFISLLGAGAAAATGGVTLTGCSDGKSGSSTSGRAETEDKLSGLLPKYTPYESVKPDLPGENGASPGYTHYPAELKRAVPEKMVPSGKEVSAMTPLWSPIPPLAGNSYFEANNERIGAPVKFNILNGNDYGDKLGPILAAGNIPELLCIPGWNISSLTRFSQAADKLFEDLTPHLAGDKVSAYPMLANLPTRAWAYGVWNSQLKAVPFPSDGFPWMMMYRKDILDQLGAEPPKNADDLLALGKQLTDAKAGRWAFGSVADEIHRAFRVPGGWIKDPSGKLVNKIETPEFEEAVAFVRKLFQSGYVHPEVVANAGADENALFEGGKFLIRQNGPGGWHESLQRQQTVNPKFNPQPVMPFAYDGGTPITWGGEPAGIFTFVKKGVGEERVKELLGVMNYTAAPFGTEEYVLYNYGVEGKHYTKQPSGAPKLTALGQKEVSQTYIFLGGRPTAITESEYPGYVQSMSAWQNASAKVREKNLFDGIRVEQPAKMAALNQPFDDALQDIYRGRKPVSELKTAVKQWQDNGGNEGRDFYAKVLSDNGR
ncbi:putative aldouronate transport system substrate-binding protein [Kribbella antiqua]|uniref:Putative aldouronate transport system substrate-binding protein n=1 Tax=Kribbella antiqua TaxID=2512217 RepID=A0A4R2IEQ8_9ACTN|nr:extracellular solute-binding protein [Kribbella antiqua]TCO42269.1 putative aldouronate transport system substrate-binding protein [Kribbella antiqua]